MDKSLKEIIENFVVSSVESLKKEKFSHPKRIVLCSSYKLKNEILIFNYTENRFLNQQYIISNQISLIKSPYYRKDRNEKEGDFVLDIGAFLKNKFVKLSAYDDF